MYVSVSLAGNFLDEIKKNTKKKTTKLKDGETVNVKLSGEGTSMSRTSNFHTSEFHHPSVGG